MDLYWLSCVIILDYDKWTEWGWHHPHTHTHTFRVMQRLCMNCKNSVGVLLEPAWSLCCCLDTDITIIIQPQLRETFPDRVSSNPEGAPAWPSSSADTYSVLLPTRTCKQDQIFAFGQCRTILNLKVFQVWLWWGVRCLGKSSGFVWRT